MATVIYATWQRRCSLNPAEFRRAMVLLLPDIRAYARFLTRRTADADDLVQDAIVRALAASDQFQPGTNFRAWSFTIVRNVFFEQVRRRRTERGAMARSIGEHDPGVERSVQPGQQHQIDLDDLSRHLYMLSPLLRDALVLVGAQGFNYEEASQICGAPVGTMKARVARARSTLARSLAQRVRIQ